MNKEQVGLAGEYAVASRICSRGHYAHVTYGNMKEMDILVYSNKSYIKVEVKSKSGLSWPFIRGIPNDDSHILVFVDYETKKDRADNFSITPDFYVLDGQDWQNILEGLKTNPAYAGPDAKDGYSPTWNNSKKKGHTIKLDHIKAHKGKWEKVDKLLEKRERASCL